MRRAIWLRAALRAGGAAAVLVGLGLPRAATAAAVPAGFVDEVVVTGLASPTAMAFAPDGRVFVCQQTGALRVIKNGVLLATPFVSLSVSSTGERGLLGVALDPAFSSNGFVYVYYTATQPSVHNRISRFSAAGDVASPGSELVLMELENLGATNHNGGALHFGSDGKLYVGVGENAVSSNAQSLSNRLGKLLRLNADGSIPSDNPFFTVATGVNRAIWALGLRNPFTFGVQAGTGRIFINDVGNGSWEEVNEGIAGANYGWPASEGPTTTPGHTSPLYAYDHSGGACAIVGAAFYNPPAPSFPSRYVGRYFFTDLCRGVIRALDPTTGVAEDFASGLSSPVDMRVGGDGALYYLTRGPGTQTGALARIRALGTPVPATTPVTLSVLAALLPFVGLSRRRRRFSDPAGLSS